MSLNESALPRTRIPLLFLNMLDCSSKDEQAQFFARKLPSDIARWSSTAPYHIAVGQQSDLTLRAQDIGAQYQADYLLSADLICTTSGVRASVLIFETREGRQK